MSQKRMRRRDSGQASIFLALFVTTLMLLFAFTTNIGMLVHAKINLQNAADAAAYAGASVQARQLTAVAYLNFEMRRALKKFLYYYFVKGTNAHTCFPYNVRGDRVTTTSGPCPARDADAMYSFALNDPRSNEDFNEKDVPGYPMLPSTCVIFDENNNYCQKATVAGVPELIGRASYGSADTIVNTVRVTTDLIIDKKLADCESRTQINHQFMGNWLLNMSPNPPTVTVGTDTPREIFNEGEMESLGILPKMALLRARIDNFEEKLNVNLANEGLGTEINRQTLDGINSSRGERDIDYFERTIQAYLSAYNNLPQASDNGIFSEVVMNELLPTRPAAEPNPLLKNPPILAKFNDIKMGAFFASSYFEGKRGVPPASSLAEDLRGACTQRRELWEIASFPLGIVKDPSTPTFYAIKLKARARLLFSPFGSDGSVTLTAYSAARPFGSRIGIDISKQLENMAIAYGNADNKAGADLAIRPFPNILVSESDNNSRSGGFASNGHLGYLRAGEAIPGSDSNSPIALTESERVRLAGAYAPWEIGFYTIPANYEAPESVRRFDFNPLYTEGIFRLAAPAYPVNGEKSLYFIRDRVKGYLSANGFAAGIDDANRPLQQIVENLLSDEALGRMDGFLREKGYDNFHPIQDPMLNDSLKILSYIRGWPEAKKYTVAAREGNAQRQQFTSWSSSKLPLDPADRTGELSDLWGRSGYSVRLVSFQSLADNLRISNDPNVEATPSNPLQRIGGAFGSTLQEDLSRIKH